MVLFMPNKNKSQQPYFSLVAKLRPKREMEKRFKDIQQKFEQEKDINKIGMADAIKILVNEKWKELFDV